MILHLGVIQFMKNEKYLLSKMHYLTGLECPKYLWMLVNKSEKDLAMEELKTENLVVDYLHTYEESK